MWGLPRRTTENLILLMWCYFTKPPAWITEKRIHPEIMFSYFRLKAAKTVSSSKYTEAWQDKTHFYLRREKKSSNFYFYKPPYLYFNMTVFAGISN